MRVQQQVPIHDGNQPPDRAIRFRVGINVGDVIPDGTDVHGDVVNVAARLQAECPSGGICVSRQVRDHVHDRLDLAFEELGALNLKNISRPVEAFVARLDVAGTATRSPVSSGHECPLLLDKPSIAVLAFTNMSGDSDQEYFSDGIADDIITELSRSRSLLVIARNSSFTYKGHAVDVKQVARELRVRYVVEGSVRRAAGRVRVNAQLVDAETGNHIWAERYDRSIEDVFAVQDQITLAVATAIGPAVADAEMLRSMHRSSISLGAWDLYQQGMWHLAKLGRMETDQARGLFERAIELDPMFAAAHAGLSGAYVRAGTLYLTIPLDDAIRFAIAHARKAVELDPTDADAQADLAWNLRFQGDMDNALVIARHALSINSNSAHAHLVMGSVLIFIGRTEEGRQTLDVFARLSPRDAGIPTAYHRRTISYYFDRNYERCAEAARRQLSTYPRFTPTYRWLAAALGQLGRSEEALAALNMTLTQSPREFEVYVHSRVPWMRPEDYEHMLDGLRKAGRRS